MQLILKPQDIMNSSHSVMSNSLRHYGLYQAGYWSGLPLPPPGDLPKPGLELSSLKSPLLAGGFFITVPPGKSLKT